VINQDIKHSPCPVKPDFACEVGDAIRNKGENNAHPAAFNSALISVAMENSARSSEMDSRSLSISLFQLMEIINNVINAKDVHAYAHSQRVAVISYLGALAVGLNPKQADYMYIAGALHDIGKIGIPDDILKKRQDLTAEEEVIVRRHPEIGAAMIKPVAKFHSIARIVLYHHERYDGKGYPYGLKGKRIPLGARIVAAADGLALLIERSRSSVVGAITEIRADSAEAYDPGILEAIEKVQTKIDVWLQAIE
jgi:HD-GYP domain-containing protein (c-di-GMP phosphodiesterase class II)